MKSSYIVLTALAVLFLMTVTAQAESRGEQIFKQKCTMCHVVNGKGGTIGPDLTKVGSGMKEMYIRSKLETPKQSNPSSSMPSFKTLPKADMDALLGYMKTLK